MKVWNKNAMRNVWRYKRRIYENIIWQIIICICGKIGICNYENMKGRYKQVYKYGMRNGIYYEKMYEYKYDVRQRVICVGICIIWKVSVNI